VPQQPVTINRFKAYGCATALYAGAGSDKVTFDNCVLADNAWHVQFACTFTCANSLLVEQSGNGVFTPNPADTAFCGHAYVTYDGPGVMTGDYLVGFDGSGHQYATVVSSVFGAADRHTNHLFSNLAFSGQPRIWFYDFATQDPLHQQQYPNLSLADPRHWGIAVRDVDGTLSGHAGYTLVTDVPMMHLTDSVQNTPDIAITNPSWSQAWMSPYLWGHLLVSEYQANGAQLDNLQQHTMVFTRDAHNGYLAATFTADFHIDPYRQMPVLSRPAAQSSANECWYTLSWSPTQANTPVSKKMKLTMEDLSAGDVMDIHLVNQDGWSGEQVSIVQGSVLTPVNVHQLPSQSSTAYARTGTQDLWLRMVNPGNTHQVQITWQ
jgi:hypothetical protein